MFFGMMTRSSTRGIQVRHRLSDRCRRAGEKAVGWDDDGDVGRVLPLLGVGYHLGLGQRYLPGKDLDALNADGAVAGFCGGQVTDGVGAVVLSSSSERVQAGVKGTSSALPSRRSGGGGEAVAADGDGHTLDGGGLTGRKGLDAESSGVLHGDTLLCW